MLTTERKIMSFGSLPQGWHYGRGSPPDHKTIAKAIWLVDLFVLAGFEKTGAFPGIDGEVMVCAYSDRGDVEITIDLAGRFDFAFQPKGGEESCEEGLIGLHVVPKIIDAAAKVGVNPWSSFALSTPGSTTTSSEENLQTWHSEETLSTTAALAFRVLEKLAPMNQPAPSVRTSTASTAPLPQPLPYSGFSMNRSYHREAA